MTQPPPNPNLHPIFPLTWNPHKGNDYNMVEEDDSWEVRAFAEDTSSVSGTTWPPRAYTCSFCQREFRSAQALGGHMNVHRHDRARARLQLAPPPVSHNLRVVPPPYSCNYTGNPAPPLGFCLVCQHLGVPCNGVFVGVEAPVCGGAEPYHLLEPIRDVSVGGGESVGADDKEAQVREVEVDLELRLGN